MAQTRRLSFAGQPMSDQRPFPENAPSSGDAGIKVNAETTVVIARKAPPPLAVGDVLGHTYRIEALLGRGGMGAVYRARHVVLGSEHAIKVILPEYSGDAKIIALLSHEAQALRSVKNDAVIEYQGLMLDEHERRYLVMEFVDGPSLAAVLKDRCFSPQEVRTLRDRLAAGLGAAHAKGIFHRDVSPDNIILPGGRPESAKIIDFGIAKSLASGDRTIIGSDFAGKYSYASPEQAGMFGGRVDGRSDIYSLGLVLATAAIGFGGKLDMGHSPSSVFEARQSVPELGRLPEELRREIAALLQPNPADRPQTMAAVAGTSGASAAGSAAPAAPTPRERSGFLRWAVAAGVLLAVAAIGAGGTYALFFAEEREAGRPAAPDTRVAAAPLTPAVPVPPPPADVAPAATPRPDAAPAGNVPREDAARVDAAPPERPTPAPVDETPARKAPDGQPATQVAAQISPAIRPSPAEIATLATQAEKGFDCASIAHTVSDDASVTLDGFVASTKDLARLSEAVGAIPGVQRVSSAVTVFSQCADAVDVLRTRTAAVNDPSGPQLRLNAPNFIYKNKDHLVVRISSKTAGHLYLDYFDGGGKVDHLLPSAQNPSNSLKPGQDIVIGEGETIYWLGDPPGPGLVTAVLSPKPLMPRRSAAEENASDYLPVLSRALETGGGSRAALAAYAVINTLP
jgi:hypothetical protein